MRRIEVGNQESHSTTKHYSGHNNGQLAFSGILHRILMQCLPTSPLIFSTVQGDTLIIL